MNWLKRGKTPGIFSILAELLEAGGNAIIMSFHAVLCFAWNTGINPNCLEEGPCPSLEREGLSPGLQQLPSGDVALSARQGLCSDNY